MAVARDTISRMSAQAIGGRINPVDHWRRVLATPGLPHASYDAAKEALARLEGDERIPGEDDEVLA